MASTTVAVPSAAETVAIRAPSSAVTFRGATADTRAGFARWWRPSRRFVYRPSRRTPGVGTPRATGSPRLAVVSRGPSAARSTATCYTRAGRSRRRTSTVSGAHGAPLASRGAATSPTAGTLRCRGLGATAAVRGATHRRAGPSRSNVAFTDGWSPPRNHRTSPSPRTSPGGKTARSAWLRPAGTKRTPAIATLGGGAPA